MLITTADAATVPGEPGVLVVAVPAFSIREALSYLSGLADHDPDQRSGAIDLAGALGCEPAALAQAAAVIISTGIRCREYRDYVAGSGAARGGWRRAARRGGADLDGVRQSCRAAGARRAAPGGCWRWPRCSTVTVSPARCSPPRRLPVPGQPGRGGPPDPQRAWSALLVLQRAGLVAVDAASAPPAVWVSPALQAAVRAVAPPDLLDRAARAAADALVQAWPQHQPRSWLAAALRSCAVSLRRAAGDALWAGGGVPGCCWRRGTAWTPPGWPARRWPGGGT